MILRWLGQALQTRAKTMTNRKDNLIADPPRYLTDGETVFHLSIHPWASRLNQGCMANQFLQPEINVNFYSTNKERGETLEKRMHLLILVDWEKS